MKKLKQTYLRSGRVIGAVLLLLMIGVPSGICRSPNSSIPAGRAASASFSLRSASCRPSSR